MIKHGKPRSRHFSMAAFFMPKKIKNPKEDYIMAVFRVEKTKNYTVMSNHHLKDKTLTLKSKGLLSLVLSLPEEWNYTTRGLAAICKEGVDCIGASLRELESAGYLERNKLRDDKGRITDTEYIIYEYPQSYPQGNPENKPNTDNPHTPLPRTASPCTENSYMDEPPTENTAQLSIDRVIKKEVITDSLNTHQSIPRGRGSYPQSSPIDRIDEIDKFNKYREIIYGNIEYEYLVDRYERESLDEIVETMLDYICGKRESVKIGGAEYPPEVVKSRLLKLDSSHIEYVLDCIKGNTTKVRNIRAYLLTTLYNAPATIDHYYRTLVNHDMAHNWGRNGSVN